MTRDEKRAAAFVAHAEQQQERWRLLTPEQRLRWLEGAKQFARQVANDAAGNPR